MELLRDLEARVRKETRRIGPLEAFRTLMAENDRLARRPDLEQGRRLAGARSAIYTELVRHWAVAQHLESGYDKPFAVVALGGTGRAEVAPCSDLDFGFLFDDALEGNAFLLELQRQVLHTDTFEKAYGFPFQPLPFSLDDTPRLAGKQLNAFLDMRPVHDPTGLTEEFRERIKATFDPFSHFLHVRGFWRDQLAQAAREFERLDRFDIKKEGLRVFLAGIWTLAGPSFRHSRDVYPLLDDPRDLQAYDFLLRIRAFLHLRRPHHQPPTADGSHPEDVLTFEDFTSFGEMLGPDASNQDRFEFANLVRARIVSARRRVALFTKGIIERELKQGRPTFPGSPIVFGAGGLYHAGASQCQTPEAKSRAALSLLLASRQHGVPIDPAELQTTFRNAGDWMTLVPELSALFYEDRGSLAESFAFLSQFDGVQERLFPGYGRFEASFDSRVLTEKKWMRGALERRKIEILEEYVREGQARLSEAISADRLRDLNRGLSARIEAARLDANHLAAIKLALKTKRLPVTDDDEDVRNDPQRPLHERFSSGLSEIPLEDYYEPYRTEARFTVETVAVTEFLVAHRRAFKEATEPGINDPLQVDRFHELCGRDEQRLRALFVFTCVDRAEWDGEKSDPARWFNIRELYTLVMARFQAALALDRTLESAGYSPDELTILKDFGVDFFAGGYRRYASRFGSHLVRLGEDSQGVLGPKVADIREGLSTILAVAARDYRGLAATVCGALWRLKLEIRQAHLFSAANQRLVLDFFHLATGDLPLDRGATQAIEDAIRRQLYIGEADEAELPRMSGTTTFQEWRPGQYRLRCETDQDPSGLVYALTYKVFRYLEGDIFGLVAYVARGRTYISVYLNLPERRSLEEAREIVGRHFR